MIKSVVKQLLLWCGLQAYINNLKNQLQKESKVVIKVAATLRDTLEMRDAWRTTAIEHVREREYWKSRYEAAARAASTLIRYDFVRTQYNTEGVVSDLNGEFVKYKALAEVFHD